MLNRNLKYWTEKATLMIEDYTPELTELMPKKEMKELASHIGATAEKDYRNQLEQTEADQKLTSELKGKFSNKKTSAKTVL